jgi:tetratricopeptide (TPR) repeat protein
MLKRPLPRALACAVLPCLFLSACALADKIMAKQTPVESRPILAEGDFAKALDDFKAEYEKTPRSRELTADYVRTAEEIKGAADRALGQQEYVRAGGIYRILLDRYDDFGPFAARLTFKKTQLERALKECRIGAVDNPAAQAVTVGDFARALDIFQAAFKENPGDVELATKYQGTVHEIKAIGDNAFAAKNFARAGGIYRVLLDRYGNFGPFAATLTFKKVQLETTLKECRIATVDNPAAQAMKAGNFVRALDIFQAAFKENPGDVDQGRRRQSLQRQGFRPGRNGERPSAQELSVLRRAQAAPRFFPGGPEGCHRRLPGKPDQNGSRGIPEGEPGQGHHRVGRTPQLRPG